MPIPELLDRLLALGELSKAFGGLPLPRVRAQDTILPEGTIVRGKVKVSTPQGKGWRSGRRGMVQSNDAAREGGRAGFPQSGAS